MITTFKLVPVTVTIRRFFFRRDLFLQCMCLLKVHVFAVYWNITFIHTNTVSMFLFLLQWNNKPKFSHSTLPLLSLSIFPSFFLLCTLIPPFVGLTVFVWHIYSCIGAGYYFMSVYNIFSTILELNRAPQKSAQNIIVKIEFKQFYFPFNFDCKLIWKQVNSLNF